MMKKMVSMAMAAVMAATLMAAAAPAEVNAAQQNTTDVSFENSSTTGIVNAEYTVKIPKAIKFTTENKSIDATVSIAPSTADGSLSQDLKVQVDVLSTYNYKLTKTDDNTKTLDYSLTYDEDTVNSAGGTMVNGAEDAADLVGILTAADTEIAGTALLTDSNAATTSGSYTDTLTYTITKLQ